MYISTPPKVYQSIDFSIDILFLLVKPKKEGWRFILDRKRQIEYNKNEKC